MIIQISDTDIPELEVYRQRSEVQLLRYNEPEPGIFICESGKVIERALEAGYEPISFLVSETRLEEAGRFVESINADIPVYYGTDGCLCSLSGYSLTGGMLAAMRRKPMTGIEEIIRGKKLAAVLENVENPTNIGAIFRSAAAMGVEAVIVTYDSSDPLYRRAARVSMGTVFQIPWTRAAKDEDYMKILSDNGFATVAMALEDNAVTIREEAIKNERRLAVILGNEGYGLREDTIKRSDHIAKIPMNPKVDSLNVGAASAVMFWELARDRIF